MDCGTGNKGVKVSGPFQLKHQIHIAHMSCQNHVQLRMISFLVDRRVIGETDEWTDGGMDKRINGLMHDEWMDRRVSGHMDEWTDG